MYTMILIEGVKLIKTNQLIFERLNTRIHTRPSGNIGVRLTLVVISADISGTRRIPSQGTSF